MPRQRAMIDELAKPNRFRRFAEQFTIVSRHCRRIMKIQLQSEGMQV